MRTILLFFCFVFFSSLLLGQQIRGISFAGNTTAAFAQTNRVSNISGAKPQGIQFDYYKLGDSQENINVCNCIPKSGISFSYFNLDKPDLLGNALSASLFIEPQYSITNRYVFGIRAQAGFVYATKKFDINTNPGNLTYSSNISNYLALGISNYYFINPKTALNLSFIFNHISNGGIKDPNNGLNFPGVNIGLNYFFEKPNYDKRVRVKPKVEKSISSYLTLFYAATTSSNFATKKYSIFGLELSGVKKINGVLFTTATFSLYQDKAVQQKLRQDSLSAQSQYRCGIASGIGFNMGKVNFASSLGVYVYDPINYYARIYHQHELSYQLNKQWAIGVNLKAHTYIANYTDIRIKYLLN